MEILQKNYYDTATQIVVNSNTTTAKNLLNPDFLFQYSSNGFNDDNTTTTITINFNETLSVSRLAMVQLNWKKFNVYYDGVTANTFSFTSTAATTTSQFINNSESSMYFKCTPQNCTSVTFDVYSTQVANIEKAVGFLGITNKHIDFDADYNRIPSSKNYKPRNVPKEIRHRLSDGGIRIHTIEQKWRVDIKFKYINSAFRDSLRTVWDLHDELLFVGFGTSTGWDEVFFPCVWSGEFNFYRYSDDAAGAGFSGDIRLEQT